MFSRRIALMSMRGSWAAIKADLVHPPLYYYLLRVTLMLFGEGPIGVRALSLLCGLLSIYLIYLLTTTVKGSRVTGLFAAAALALNTTHIIYSQEARSYAWYTMLVILLAIWTCRIIRNDSPAPGVGLWLTGAVLMCVTVYTHYVGGIYVACAVLAVVVADLPGIRRLGTSLCGLFAAASFIPWLTSVVGVYRSKHGLSENLGWQGTPSLYDLKAVYASALGIPTFGGATTIVVLLMAALIVSAAAPFMKRGSSGANDMPLPLVLLGVVPPMLLFMLSKPPVNLPLFGMRHLLPSVPLLIVLCLIGLERLAHRFDLRTNFVVGAAACLLLFPCSSTFTYMRSLPSRFPYDTMSLAVERYASRGVPSYTTWFYGTAEPINFYCHTECVKDLPRDDASLPKTFVLLYRPDVAAEQNRFEQLRADGFAETELASFTKGVKTSFATTLVRLSR